MGYMKTHGIEYFEVHHGYAVLKTGSQAFVTDASKIGPRGRPAAPTSHWLRTARVNRRHASDEVGQQL